MTEAKQAIRRGVELGMTHLDTAEMYGSGRVEELLGDAIEGIPRERIFVTSKVLPSNARYDATLKACEKSLKRMRLEYFDLYLLHWPSNHPLEETMRALETLVEQGKTRFIGVSNFDVDEMNEAASYLRNVPLACNQVLYHLHERGVEHALIPEARKRNVAIVAYTPFGRGQFPRAESKAGGVLGADRCKTRRDPASSDPRLSHARSQRLCHPQGLANRARRGKRRRRRSRSRLCGLRRDRCRLPARERRTARDAVTHGPRSRRN